MTHQNCDLKLTKSEIAAAFADEHWAELYPPVLSVNQVARLFQVPKSTVYSWSSRGRLRGCGRRVGKYLRFFRDRVFVRVFNEGL